MAAPVSTFFLNDGSSTYYNDSLTKFPDPDNFGWAYDNHIFLHWNTYADDSGTSYNVGDYIDVGGVYYAIWQEESHEVTISYNNTTVTSMDATGSKTLQTAGKFCESNFTIEYTKPTPNLQSKSATPSTSSQTVTPDSGYDGLSQVSVSAMPSGSTTQNAPTINTSTGLVTATATVATGYQVASTKSNTLQLTTQAAQTITPTTTDQTIASGKYLTGTQTIKGDANLLPVNIAQGVSIFGVQGTHSGGGSSGINDFIENRDTWTSYENLSVSRIANGTFYQCYRLSTVSFPECTSIGSYAFAYCSSLSTASFSKCTSIGSYAFASCRNLSTVSFPVCKTISERAFISCINLSTVSFPECTSIGTYAFAYCSSLSTVSFPECTSIGTYAFAYCSSLSTASFSKCTFISSYAFAYCTNLSTASFPVCTSIGAGAFNSCTNLSTVSFPVCTSIGNRAFYLCSKLTTISFPMCTTIDAYVFASTSLSTASFSKCTSIGSYAFAYCSSLNTVSFPVCTSIGSYAFNSCTNLSTVSFPVCTSIDSNAFAYCRNLSTASFTVCTTIGNSAFFRCYMLTSLYLTGSSYVTLSNSNAFTSTPIGGYTTSTGGVYGSIYVPASMLVSYKTRTNWTYFSSRFVAY